MNRVTVNLKNCYGIKKLQYEFDFNEGSVYAIYAPNGLMKSSFMQTFHDVADGVDSKDRVFPARKTERIIKDEAGNDVAHESVFAVRSYDQEFGPSEKTAKLLVDAKLRKQYEQLQAGIDESKSFLLKAIREQSQSKRDFEKEISSAFTSSENEFETAVTRIRKEVSELKEPIFADIPYDKVFDDKIVSFFDKNKDAKGTIDGWVARYNELLAASLFFKKGIFDYYNAGKIAKTLADNGFFDAKHTVSLNSEQQKLPISTPRELEAVIHKEKETIIKDAELTKEFNKLAALLEKNETLREFANYLLDHTALVSNLANMKKFKEDVLKSYLRAKCDLYTEMMNRYDAASSRKKEIEDEAAKQFTQWEQVIKIFNERFVVPFTLEVKNRTAVMLGNEQAPILGFIYEDGKDKTPIEHDALLEALSTGEKKALYILNVIFEVEVRRKEGRESIVVIDDIADSFDYQNKYAIIQYLNEMKDDGLFRQIIMTHNFDFFRTITSRFVGNYAHCLMARQEKDDKGVITLEKGSGIKNVFLNDLKKHFCDDPKKRIAAIPFIRNMIELMTDDQDARFLKLTSLLHWKKETPTIKESDLDRIFNELFSAKAASGKGTRVVVELIHEEAKKCLKAPVGINFENKIVLAIATRLAAEKFMIEKISDAKEVDSITSHQTQTLFELYKSRGGNGKAASVLGRVVLMTPENIHLNSFMYEPIVDMSDEHLRRLYSDVCGLK